jgi:hypothetical protein
MLKLNLGSRGLDLAHNRRMKKHGNAPPEQVETIQARRAEFKPIPPAVQLSPSPLPRAGKCD